MPQCPQTAYFHAQGIIVGTLRCDEEEGHLDDHRVTLRWGDGDDAAAWPEAFDPAEDFDVEVDALPHDEVIDARLEQQSVGDDETIERSHAAVDDNVRSRLDTILDDAREGLRQTEAERRRS